MLGEFPMGRHWAASLFAAVLPQSRIGNIHVGHRDQVAAQLERAVWLRGASLGDVMARVKAAYALLDMAFEQASERMALIVDQTFVRLEELQEREFHHQNTIEATSKDDLEAKFGTYLALYAFTYDQYFRSLAAPLVVADAVTRTGEADSALVDQDGRARTARLPDLEHERGVKAGIFSDGLERHLRNSAAHHRYTILGDDSIRLWDVDEHSGKTTWGPVDWKFWDLRTSVYKLSNSCSVLLLALGMFDIAHGRTIKERGWGIRGRPRPKRRDIAKSELLTMADLHGFTVEAVAVAADGALAVSLIVKGETVIDQTVQIMAGGHGARSFLEQKVRTEWGPLRSQVYGFLQTTLDAHGGYDVVRVGVTAQDRKANLGSVEFPYAERISLVERHDDVEEIRKRLPVDTLADQAIPIVIKGPIVPVGTSDIFDPEE